MFLNMHNKNNNYYCYYNNKQWLCISCMLCVTVSHCRGWKDIVSWCSSASTHVCFWSLLCTSLQPCIHWCGILTRSRQTELAKRGRHVLVTCSHHRLTSVTGSDWLSTDWAHTCYSQWLTEHWLGSHLLLAVTDWALTGLTSVTGSDWLSTDWAHICYWQWLTKHWLLAFSSVLSVYLYNFCNNWYSVHCIYCVFDTVVTVIILPRLLE